MATGRGGTPPRKRPSGPSQASSTPACPPSQAATTPSRVRARSRNCGSALPATTVSRSRPSSSIRVRLTPGRPGRNGPPGRQATRNPPSTASAALTMAPECCGVAGIPLRSSKAARTVRPSLLDRTVQSKWFSVALPGSDCDQQTSVRRGFQARIALRVVPGLSKRAPPGWLSVQAQADGFDPLEHGRRRRPVGHGDQEIVGAEHGAGCPARPGQRPGVDGATGEPAYQVSRHRGLGDATDDEQRP